MAGKGELIRCRVSPSFKEEFEQFCEEYGEGQSTVIRLALREFIRKRENNATTTAEPDPGTITRFLSEDQKHPTSGKTP